jgi:Protein of unknown function (DUF3987)
VALGESGDWQGAVTRISKIIAGEEDPLEGALPEGYASGMLLEQLSRQLEADRGIELGMTLPSVVSAFSGATQGGFLVPLPFIDPETGKLNQGSTAPIVCQFVGIAEAGQQKSTLLKEIVEPLKTALDREAAEHRRTIVEKWRKAAMDQFGATGGTVDQDAAAWEKVYNGGLCTSSLTDQGTPEGIRNNIVRHGGHRVILTAEPDVLMEVSQYANKGTGGSIGLFLRGWGQEDLAVDRAGTEALYAREISLPYVILLQPDSFVNHTGAGGKGDDFVDRGFFSRTWLWQAERTVAAEVDDDWDFGDLNLAEAFGTPFASPFTALREQMTESMVAVATRSNEYRVSKGLEQAWRESKVLWMPRPKEVHRERLDMDGPDGLRAVLRVQKMRALIRQAVAERDAVERGAAKLIDPMAVRFTDHAMRWAANMTLAADPESKTVDTALIEDVATRILPWLWSGWMKVMRSRLEHKAQEDYEESFLKNPQQHDLRPGKQILKALLKLQDMDAAGGMVGGWTASKVFEGPRSAMRKQGKSSGAITVLLNKELDRLVGEGLVEKTGSGEASASGKAFGRYRLAPGVADKIKSDAL